MRIRTASRIAIALATIVTASVAALPSGAQAATTLPVVYSAIPAGAAMLAHPDAPPPGANEWNCKPSAAHPQPVVLLHGLGANMTLNWNTISPLLKNNGYCVYALTYGQTPGAPFPIDQVGGVEAMQKSVVQVSAFVNRVLASTGATKVDLVGHSEGTFMPEYWLKYLGGASEVEKYVAMAPLYQGTDLGDAEQLEQAGDEFGITGRIR